MRYAIDSLRKKALNLLRERHALVFMISGVDKSVLQVIQSEWEHIKQANKTQLQSYIQRTSSDLIECKKQYGVRATSEQIIKFLENAEAAPPGQCYLPTVAELREYFHSYEKVWPDSALLPSHARVFFDPSGLVPGGSTRILEATIYEDMAAL